MSPKPPGHAPFVAPLALGLSLLIAACATTPAQKRPQGTTTSAPKWRAVPARADGAHVAGGRRHRIKTGETGLAIAQAYGVSWRRIAAANNIAPDATLYAGRFLFIPTTPPAARTPAPQRQASRTARPPATPAAKSPPASPQTPEDRAAAFNVDIDDLISGSTPATAPPATASRTATASAPPPPASAENIPALLWPIEGRTILSTFGAKPGGRFNDGINIKARKGQSVRAAADGEVIYVGDAIESFGLLMLVRHKGGIITAYGHLSDALVGRGTGVARGQVIARAGDSGAVSEAQLLFELRKGRKALNPLPYLRS